MSLFEKESISNMYSNLTKKSIYLPELAVVVSGVRKYLVFILSILILIISPFVFGFFSGFNTGLGYKQTELFLSPRSEDFFGVEITKMLLQDYEEQNPDFLVRLFNEAAPPAAVSGTHTSVQDQLREAIRNLRVNEKDKTPVILGPDILVFDEGELNSLIVDGALLPLNPCFESGAELFAFPLVSFMDLLFYNIELLQAAGFDRPPKTRNEFLAYATTVSNTSGDVAGAAMGLNPKDRQSLSRDIFSWIWADGSDFWPGSGAQGPLINTRPIIADFTFLGRLYREGALAPGTFEATGEQRLEEFAQGKIAMIIASSRVIPALREKMGDNTFGITTIPATDSAGKYSIGISSIYAGISAATPYPDEARAFLDFFSEYSPLFSAELKAVPGVVSNIIPGNYAWNDPFYSKARDIFYSAEIIHGFSGKTGALEYENIVWEELQAFFETNRTAQETVAAIQRRWNDVLAPVS